MKKLYPIVFIIILFAKCTDDLNTPEKPSWYSELNNYTTETMNEYSVPGIQICVLDNNTNKQVVIARGYADIENNIEMKDDTKIKVGSITKSFTGISVLLLAQRGLLDLNASINEYVLLEDTNYSKIKIKQLLNMNSGLRGYLNDDDNSVIIDRIISNPSMHIEPMELIERGFQLTDLYGVTPKNEFHYNNTNYILLGLIIESISQTNYNEFVYNELISPLALNNTYVATNNNYASDVAGGYHIDLSENTSDNYSNLDLSYVWSAGAVISNATDLCKWISAIANGNIIDDDFSEFIYSGQPVADSVTYTSGLISESNRLWHNGTVLGYHGEMCYLKDKNISIAVLSNCSIAGAEGDPVKQIMEKVIELIENN